MKTRTLRLRCDSDYLRLATYRHVLKVIAEREGMQPWQMPASAPDPGEMAAAALRHFGDDADPVQP